MNIFLFLNILPIVLISLLLCIFTLPYAYKIGIKLGIIDSLEERKVNLKYNVRFGSLAIVLPFYLTITIAFFLYNNFAQGQSIDFYPLIFVPLFTGIVFFLIGLLDDLFCLSPFLRLGLQIIAVCIGIGFGFQLNVQVFQIFIDLDHNYLIKSLNIIFTIIFLVGLTNSFNWIDGLDGLASGITAIVNIGFLTISLLSNNIIGSFLSASIIGTSLGFLRYNSYPSKIIMGDGGSYFLGYMSGIIGIFTFAQIGQNNLIIFSFNDLLTILLILFVPIVDMAVVILRRIKRGKSPFYPDRTHLHHYIYDKGLNHKKTVILIYMLSQWFASLSITLKVGLNLNLMILSSLLLIFYLGFIFRSFDYKLLKFKD